MESKLRLNQIFYALSDDKRRFILDRLSEGPVKVSDLAEHFDNTLATVSKNISLLEKAGLLYKVKQGRTVYCHMNHDTWLDVAKYVSGVANFWQSRMSDLESYVIDQSTVTKTVKNDSDE